MKLYPAIDLRGGQAVRLYQGDYDRMTVYNADPVAQAQQFIDAGAKYLHVVDLDGAKDDTTANLQTIAAIAKLGGLKIEVGGGIRDEARIQRYLDLGADRCILGTAAVKNFDFTAEMAQKYGAQIAVGVDMKDGAVAVNGWKEVTPEPGVAFCRRCANAGVKAIIATDISRDGTMQGTNMALYRELLTIPGIEVTASGGWPSFPPCTATQPFWGSRFIRERLIWPRPCGCTRGNEDMITKRIIPCLDVKNGRVVKGVNFEGLQDMADPVEMARYYNASGADELVFYDITASVEGRGLFTDILRRVASQIFIPLTVGGGINTLDDFDRVLKCGADKVSVNSGAIRNPGIIPAAAQKYGNQCVVLSADIKRVDGKFMLFAKGGRENTGIDALDWLEQGVKNGAGELVVNSIDTDGVKNGFDLELLDAVAARCAVPIIASGGAGKKEDFLELFRNHPAVDAGLAASIFHTKQVEINDLKRYLRENGVEMRV